MKAEKAYSVEFFSSAIWWLDTLKRREKIIRQNAFDKKEKETKVEI